MGFRGMRFVVHVRRFRGMKIKTKLMSEILKAVSSCKMNF